MGIAVGEGADEEQVAVAEMLGEGTIGVTSYNSTINWTIVGACEHQSLPDCRPGPGPLTQPREVMYYQRRIGKCLCRFFISFAAFGLVVLAFDRTDAASAAEQNVAWPHSKKAVWRQHRVFQPTQLFDEGGGTFLYPVQEFEIVVIV